MRFDTDLSSLTASTFLGGSSSEAVWPVGLALDMEGNVYVSGGTSSSDFPTNPDAYDVSFHGYIDAFVSALDRDLSAGELRPMAVEIEKLDATMGKLSWGTVPNATHYDVYKSTTPFFAPVGAPWQTVEEPTLSVEFTGGIGDESENYYFIGRARNPTEQSAEWGIVGEHDFSSTIPVSAE